MNNTNRLASLSIDYCQICGHSSSYALVSKNRKIKEIEYHSTWVECELCGSAHIDPYPSQDELKKFYAADYTELHKLYYSKNYEKVIFENYGLSLKDAGLSINHYQEKSILDYGCANGVFYKYLIEIQNLDRKNIFGCDIESDTLKTCKKLSSNFFSIEEVYQIQKRFDLITLWNVIEHIFEPQKEIKSIVQLLKDDGQIFIETPMFGKLAQKLGADWSHYLVTEHINLFSRSAIKKMFEDIGFKCISESSFGANIFGNMPFNKKKALDKIVKENDSGATQVLLFKKI